jgi:hypothetical protein
MEAAIHQHYFQTLHRMKSKLCHLAADACVEVSFSGGSFGPASPSLGHRREFLRRATKGIINGTNLLKLVVVITMALLCSPTELKAQLIPPDPYYQLDFWSFAAPDWLSEAGDAPLSFTNLNNPPSFDGNSVQVDTNEVAWLQYAIADSTVTNLTFVENSIEMWVLPDWNSGTGPGDWGRLIDVGAYSTNAPSSVVSHYCLYK